MFICINCGNKQFFETEVETAKALFPTAGILMVDNIRFEDFEASEDYLRSNLRDVISDLKNMSAADLCFNKASNRYYNDFICCACCGSKEVSVRFHPWSPVQRSKSLQEELFANLKTYLQLKKKEKNNYGHTLPVLWRAEP